MAESEVRCLGVLATGEWPSTTVVRGRTDASVLALLCTQRDGIRVDEMLETVWQRDARSPLVQSIYRLRKRLGSRDAIREEGGRYRLCTQVDAWRFESLIAEGIAGQDTQLLHTALELWRGEPFEGLDDLTAFHDVREHLRRTRNRALEAVSSLATIDPDILLPIVRSGALSEPWNESLTMAAMTAFAECGQVSDALELADRCRSRLSADLDVETSPAFDAYEALIREQATVAIESQVSSRTGPQAPHRRADETDSLVERDDALDRLDRVVSLAATGPGRIILVSGPAGVGKTALCSAFLAGFDTSVTTVRRGESRSGDPVAYDVVLQSLPELDDSLDQLREERDASVGRLLFARDAERQLAELAREQPVFVLIEDLHDIDDQSLTLLSHIAERALPAGLTLILTSRPPTVGSAGGEAFTWLSTRPIVEHIELAPLSDAGIRRMIDSRYPLERGADRARLADYVAQKSRGIPLVAEMMTRSADPELTINVDEDASADAIYHAQIEPDDRVLIATAALVGFTFDFDTLLEVCDIDSPALAAALSRAIASGVIHETERLDEFEFRHELVRDHFSTMISGPLRRTLFATLALRPVVREAELLRYVRGAGTELDPELARSRLFDAAGALRANRAFAEARAVLLELLDLLPAEDPRRSRALLGLAECAARCGLPVEAVRWRSEASVLCRSDEEIAFLAVSGYPDGEFVGGEPDRLPLFDRVPAVAHIDSVSDAFYFRCHLRIARLAGDLARVRGLLATLDDDTFSNEPEGRIEVEFERLLIEAAHDGKPIHDELAALADQLEPGALRVSIRHRQVVAARVEQLAPIDELLREVAAEARLWGSPFTRWALSQLEIATVIERHRLDADDAARQESLAGADAMITRSHQAAVRRGVANADAGLAAQTFLQLWNRGDLVVALPLVDAASAESTPNPGWMAAAAFAAAAAGDTSRARQEADRVLGIFSSVTESNWRLNAAAILVEAAWLAGFADAAEAAAAELVPRSGRAVLLGVGSVSLGPVDRYLAKAAALTGATDPVPLLEAAIAQAETTQSSLWVDRARRDRLEIEARRPPVGSTRLA